MALANVARRQGDDFQARLFWLKAASLLDPASSIKKVAYETGPKSFDDILIEYHREKAPPDQDGYPIYRRHIQCKWHTTAGIFGYKDLIDPAFINATRFSFLEKAHTAQTQYAPDGLGCRFELVTNWRLLADDPLIRIVRKESDALDMARLFDSTTDKSIMGKVRKLWREHLNLDDHQLRLVTRVLAIAEMSESLSSLRERLDEKFMAVGMLRVPAAESSFIYDDLALKLLSQGRVEFDKDSFREMCQKEKILDTPGKTESVLTIGIRSFMHPIDALEDRCEHMLNLVPYFDGRYIREKNDWKGLIRRELTEFVLGAARSTDYLRLVLDAHVSLAVATGAILDVKSGKHIEIEQRTGGRRFWSMNDGVPDDSWAKFLFEEEVIGQGQKGIVISVGLTHDISVAVRDYADSQLPNIGYLVHSRLENGPSQKSIRCGHHAWILAESLVQYIRRLRERTKDIWHIHLFIAGPNGFAFFLGQHQRVIGPITIYEWDFDGYRGGGYQPGISLDK